MLSLILPIYSVLIRQGLYTGFNLLINKKQRQSRTKTMMSKARSILTPWVTLVPLMMILNTESGKEKWGDKRPK